MNTLVHIFAWLLPDPHFARLWLSTHALLRHLVRALVDPQTKQLRDLPIGALCGVERCLQIADACLARLVWLRARSLAGLVHLPNTRCFADQPPRRVRTAEAIARHAVTLLERLHRIEIAARRLAARMSQSDERNRGSAQPASQPFATIPTLIASSREAPGRAEPARAPARRAAALIAQTGPPPDPDIRQFTPAPLRNRPIPVAPAHACTPHVCTPPEAPVAFIWIARAARVVPGGHAAGKIAMIPVRRPARARVPSLARRTTGSSASGLQAGPAAPCSVRPTAPCRDPGASR